MLTAEKLSQAQAVLGQIDRGGIKSLFKAKWLEVSEVIAKGAEALTKTADVFIRPG